MKKLESNLVKPTAYYIVFVVSAVMSNMWSR